MEPASGKRSVFFCQDLFFFRHCHEIFRFMGFFFEKEVKLHTDGTFCGYFHLFLCCKSSFFANIVFYRYENTFPVLGVIVFARRGFLTLGVGIFSELKMGAFCY
jgi:hypothetical protein